MVTPAFVLAVLRDSTATGLDPTHAVTASVDLASAMIRPTDINASAPRPTLDKGNLI